MNDYITATIMNTTTQIPRSTTLYDLSKNYANHFKYPIILAKVNNELHELFKTPVEDCEIEFLDITDPNGFRTYQRSVSFLMITSAKDILGRSTRVVIEHSIDKNYYCELYAVTPESGPSGSIIEITDEMLEQIEARMKEIVDDDTPIEKMTVSLEEGMRISKELGLRDKELFLKYRRTSNVNFYKLDWFCDYFYGPMVPSTGYLKNFRLVKRSGGFMLQFPSSSTHELSELKPSVKISQVFAESNTWARILKVDTVGALNDIICSGGLGDIMRVTEALHEKKIAYLADTIYQQGKTIVLIAGPSSSGKTTFAERLCIQLRVNGLKPHVISLDNYFVNRDKTPRDEEGKLNYEAVEALDLKQINEDLQNLLEGNAVEMPIYNFIIGGREHKGKSLRLGKEDVLVIEGIHGLNERVTSNIPKSAKFKIFISALTQLNIDDHNRIPTTDTRIIRRIVRDNQFRGIDAAKTISMWPSVTRGENLNIFPFQEEADAFFNSALVYELGVLKQYAEPLLFNVDKSLPQYTEAKRLIKFLDCFLGVASEAVPSNSILREFIGGSCFNT